MGEENGGAPEVVPTSNGTGADGTLVGMFRRAYHLGKLRDGMAIAEAAASLRPRFGLSHMDGLAPTVIPLAGGDEDPMVFCIPSLVASSGPHEYARFAKSLQGRCPVVAVPVPGFASGELLGSKLAAVAGAQAAAIKRHADGRPVALVGFSTGGLLAYAVAAECARAGLTPTAVVLIDFYTMETAWPIADVVVERMLGRRGRAPGRRDDRLAAMGAYLGLLSRWTPPTPVAPTLLIKATDPVPGVVRVGDGRATWPLRHAAVDLPGTHLSILEDHVDATAPPSRTGSPAILAARRRALAAGSRSAPAERCLRWPMTAHAGPAGRSRPRGPPPGPSVHDGARAPVDPRARGAGDRGRGGTPGQRHDQSTERRQAEHLMKDLLLHTPRAGEARSSRVQRQGAPPACASCSGGRGCSSTPA